MPQVSIKEPRLHNSSRRLQKGRENMTEYHYKTLEDLAQVGTITMGRPCKANLLRRISRLPTE